MNKVVQTTLDETTFLAFKVRLIKDKTSAKEKLRELIKSYIEQGGSNGRRTDD